MGLTTHELDTMHGTPAAGMACAFSRLDERGVALRGLPQMPHENVALHTPGLIRRRYESGAPVR